MNNVTLHQTSLKPPAWTRHPRVVSAFVFSICATAVAAPIAWIAGPALNATAHELAPGLAALSAAIAALSMAPRVLLEDKQQSGKLAPGTEYGVRLTFIAQALFSIFLGLCTVRVAGIQSIMDLIIVISVFMTYALGNIFICWITLPIGGLIGARLHRTLTAASKPRTAKVLGCGTPHSRRGGPPCPPALTEVPLHE